MKEFSEEDANVIMQALNQMWNDANQKLQEKGLGDIERENYQYAKKKSKEIMDKLDNLC